MSVSLPIRPLAVFTLVGLAAMATAFTTPQGIQDGSSRKARKASPIRWDGTVIHTLQVRDLAAAKKWYGEVLGCKVFFDLSKMGWCEVTTPVPNALIGLQQFDPKKGKFTGNGGSNLSLGVKNIEQVRTWLLKHGAKAGAVQEIPKTVKLLKFSDPDGNQLMLHQPHSGE